MPSPKEIRRTIRDRKRQHEEAVKSPAQVNRRLAELAAEKGVKSVATTCKLLDAAGDVCDDPCVPGEDACSYHLAARLFKPDSYGQPGQGSTAGMGEKALGQGDGDVPPKPPAPKPAKVKKRRLGRLPHGSRFETLGYDSLTERWIVSLMVPMVPGPEIFSVEHTSLHTALELLWDSYVSWKVEQPRENKDVSAK